jgi:hypothetical protein
MKADYSGATGASQYAAEAKPRRNACERYTGLLFGLLVSS